MFRSDLFKGKRILVTGGGTGLTYTPDADFCGTDSFSYTLNGGDSAQVSITVTCVDDAPTADAGAPLSRECPAIYDQDLLPTFEIEITDGTRSIELGQRVNFQPLPKFGRFQAGRIHKV